MKMQEFNFTYEDIVSCNPSILWQRCDFWKEDNNGCAHRLSAGYNGELWTVKVPDIVPLKYKGRKLSRLVVWLNACELVKGIEAFYGRPSCGGHLLAITDGTVTDMTAEGKRRGL